MNKINISRFQIYFISLFLLTQIVNSSSEKCYRETRAQRDTRKNAHASKERDQNARFILAFLPFFFLQSYIIQRDGGLHYQRQREGKRESNGNSIIIIARPQSVEKLCGGARVAAVPAINSEPRLYGAAPCSDWPRWHSQTNVRIYQGEPRLIIRLKNRRKDVFHPCPFPSEYLSLILVFSSKLLVGGASHLDRVFTTTS